MDLRGYIVSVLDNIGIKFKSDADLRMLVSLIESCVINPDLDLNKILDGFCNTRGLTRKTADRMIDSSFDVYNEEKLNSIMRYTQTVPITNKDAFCDVVVAIRLSTISYE